MLPVTGFYAGLLAFGFVTLAMRTIRLRGTYRIAIGSPHRLLERAVRAHGNFAEYVPFALLLLALNELNRLPDWALHLLGVMLVTGRVLHAIGISREPENLRWRMVGMVLTFTVIIVAAASLLGMSAAAL